MVALKRARFIAGRIASSLVLLAVMAAGGLAGCAGKRAEPKLVRFEFQQPHMGTMFTITLYAFDEINARNAADAAFNRIAALDRLMTDYDPGSELMRLSRQPVGRPAPVSAELFEVLQKAQAVAARTDGGLDITVGPLVRQWRRARRTGTLPKPEALTKALASVGWDKLRLDASKQTVALLAPDMQLDLGGIGKGFAVDKALETLRRYGVTRALVAGSGDLAIGDPPPDQAGWRVEIGLPGATNAAPSPKVFLKNVGVSTAGDAEQFVEIEGRRYSHIVDPKTGVGLTNHIQVSVIAPTATDSDGFDTAVSVFGASRAAEIIAAQPGFSAVIVWQVQEQEQVTVVGPLKSQLR